MDTLLLGIDIGTTSVKAALLAPDGRLEGVKSADYPIHYVRPGWVEQQPEDWWKATCLTVRQVLSSVPQGRERVAGIAVSAQAPTLLALDRSGQPLRPAMIWMDRRAEAETRQLIDHLSAETIIQISGNRPDAYYVAAKIRWLKNHEPELLAKTHQFVQINGYINYRLTGTLTLDNAHAALLQLRDYRDDTWSAALCDACGADPAQFPPVCPGHQIQSEVTPEAAEATSLLPGTPVLAGTVDAAAAAIEAGVGEAGIAAEMTGTSTVLILPNTAGVTEPALISMPHALPGMYLTLGAMVSSGASLNWYRDQFGLPEQQASTLLNANVFDLLMQPAERIPPGSGGLIFLPYMMGERSPLWHTQARGVLFGLSLATERGAVVRALLEGTAFALRHNLDVARQAGIEAREMRSVGGGTKSALWNQIKADVLGLPVLLPAAAVGAPFGDAVLVGLALGLYSDAADTLRKLVQIKTVYQPDPERHARYNEYYAVFRSLYPHLRDDYDRLAAVATGSASGAEIARLG